MYPTVSQEMLSGAVELICLASTAMVAIVSYLLTLRM